MQIPDQDYFFYTQTTALASVTFSFLPLVAITGGSSFFRSAYLYGFISVIDGRYFLPVFGRS